MIGSKSEQESPGLGDQFSNRSELRRDPYFMFIFFVLSRQLGGQPEKLPISDKERFFTQILVEFAARVRHWRDAAPLMNLQDAFDSSNLTRLVFGEIEELGDADTLYQYAKKSRDRQHELHALLEVYCEALDVLVLLVSQARAQGFEHNWAEVLSDGVRFEKSASMQDILLAQLRFQENPTATLQATVIRLVAGFIFGLNSGNPKDLLEAADLILLKIEADKTKKHFQPAGQAETTASLTQATHERQYDHNIRLLRLIRGFFKHGSLEKMNDDQTMPGYRYLLEPFMVAPFSVLLENFDESVRCEDRLRVALVQYESFMRDVCDRQLRVSPTSDQPRLPRKVLQALLGWFAVRDRRVSGEKPRSHTVASVAVPLELTASEWQQLSQVMHQQLIPQFWRRYPDLDPAKKGLQSARR